MNHVRWLLGCAGALAIVACGVRQMRVAPLEPAETPLTVESPIKAHLADGSTVVFADGATVANGQLQGAGIVYDLTLTESARITSLDLDQIAAMESYQTVVDLANADMGKTVGVVIGVAAGAAATAALGSALFGSCPTLYIEAGDHSVLQAESFSYSIAPIFEAADVDRIEPRLATGSPPVLEIRNEALETHYINSLALLQVGHDLDEAAYPDPAGTPVVVGGSMLPLRAIDSTGRDVTRILDRSDGVIWETPLRRLEISGPGQHEDFLDLEVGHPAGAQELAVVMRLRNTLLSTTLLYDVMLRGQGWHALDWMGRTLREPLAALNLVAWYRSRMGMRVTSFDGETYRLQAHIPDQGPIAWKELAVVVPASADGVTRLRLNFVVDNWHVDWIEARPDWRPASVVRLQPREIRDTGNRPVNEALAVVSETDQSYLVTQPGARITAHFEAAESRADPSITYMASVQGYYLEWMRADWLNSPAAQPLEPGDALLDEALALWRERREGFREQFESSRIFTP